MGVSLERVQYKFASIIGELCSEPVVLSQFAIWLDLRLAEYKSKGAISLDCSGEKPDPSWLKGMKSAAIPMIKRVLGSRLAPRGQGFSRGGINSRSSLYHKRNTNSHPRVANDNQTQQPAQTNDQASERLAAGDNSSDSVSKLDQLAGSDDIMVIKDEPGDGSQEDVYPISLHAHSDSRKRTADSSAGQEPVSSPFHKVRKLPSSTSSVSQAESPLNQSLISVIGNTFDEQNQELSGNMDTTGSDLDFTVSLEGQTGEDSANIQWADNSANFYMSSTDSPTSSTFARRSAASATVTSDSGLSQGNIISSEAGNHDGNVSTELESDSGLRPNISHPRAYTEWITSSEKAGNISAVSDHSFTHLCKTQSHNKRSKERISEIQTKARSTARMIVSAIATFERWLKTTDCNDSRRIENIPPAELDVYLAEFFSVITKPCGRQYKLETFRILRCNIDSYLKEKGYPCSISKSTMFAQSQNAFNVRKDVLKQSGSIEAFSSVSM